MTDKQIIDGVDVSGCQFFEKEDNYCNIMSCDCHNNCYYKQLKRKEQECEQLKNLFKGVQKSLEVEIEECAKWSQIETETRYALLKKERECEELKKERDTLSVTRTKLLDDLWVAEENLKDYIEHFNKASDELDQLKQTLTEIKEIIYFNKANRMAGGACISIEQILQKISEVEE